MTGLDNSEILSLLCKTSDDEADNRQVHIPLGAQVAARNRHSTHSLTLCNAALRLQVIYHRLHHGRLAVRLDLPVFRKQAVLLQATQSLLHLYRCCISRHRSAQLV